MPRGPHLSRTGFLACCVALATWLVAPAAADTLTYENARFGTLVVFPAELFSETMDPPENGDGMTWLAADGASLAVYGMHNALMVGPGELADQAGAADGRPGFEVTYRRVGSDWVVLSGYEGDEVFYHRLEFGAGDVIHAMLMKYPAALKEKYDPLVGPIAASLAGP